MEIAMDTKFEYGELSVCISGTVDQVIISKKGKEPQEIVISGLAWREILDRCIALRYASQMRALRDGSAMTATGAREL